MAIKLRDRLAGIFALIEYVQLRGGCDIAEVAEQFAMDLQELEAMLVQLSVIDLPHLDLDDLPVVDLDLLADDGIVDFMSVPDVRIFNFTEAEARGLALGLRLVLPTVIDSELRGCLSLLQKLEAHFALEDFSQYIEVVTNPQLKAYQQLLAATVEQSARVQFTYVNAAGQLTERVMKPERLEVQGGNLLVFGHCYLSGETRAFRVSRMKDLQHFSGEFTGEALVKVVKQRRFPQVKVLLEQLPESYAEAALQVREKESGVEVTLRVLNPAWLKTQLLLHADLVKACSNETLLEQVRAEAEQTRQLYDLLEAK